MIYPKGWQQRQIIPEPKSRAWRIISSLQNNLSIRWDSIPFYGLHTMFPNIDFIHALYYYWNYCSINDQNTSVFLPDTNFPEKFCQKVDFLQSISNTNTLGSCEDKAILEPKLGWLSPKLSGYKWIFLFTVFSTCCLGLVLHHKVYYWSVKEWTKG